MEQCAQIIGGSIVRGSNKQIVKSVNYGQSKHLKSYQLYFYSEKVSREKQLKAIRHIQPLGVVLPRTIHHTLIPSTVALIRVANPYTSFWRLALWNWRKNPVRVVAITGSAGKTTTTEMLTAILMRKYPLIKTQGNLNTLTFLPMYLARLSSKHKLLVLEMGMKSLRNIARQCSIVKPNLGAITNVGEAHAGSLGGADRVVRAKQELIDGMQSRGTLFLNADDTRSRRLNTRHFRGKILRFGINNPASLQAERVRFTSKGMKFDLLLEGRRHSFSIPVLGVHNVYNALAAIGISRALGLGIHDIQKGLARFPSPRMRMQVIKGTSNRLLINDAWNANPSAMIAGLKVLRHLANNRPAYAVLGDMLELGQISQSAHHLVGKYVASLPLRGLITIGNHAKQIAQAAIHHGMDRNRVSHYTNHQAVIRHLRRTPARSVIYFKASRKLHLEKVVRELR